VRPDLTTKNTLSTHAHSGKAGPERTTAPERKSSKLRPLARFALPLVAAFTVIGMVAAPASANRRQDAMSWAMRQIGCQYTWGGTGPCSRGFDCSGLVVAAYAHVGIGLPRTTYEMLRSRELKPQLDHPKPGNLVFFGDGHVTLYFWRHVVLQAPEPGENVQLTRWYPGSSWVPTGYYKIRDAGNGPMAALSKWVHSVMYRYHLRIHNHTNLRDVLPRR
jgi:cell wall-associated NlpC family hydrolase